MEAALGFVGIGLMGRPMVVRLLEAGHVVHVYNRDATKCAPCVAKGAVLATDLGTLARAVDVVMICVSDTEAVRDVIAALLPHLRAGQRVVDFSSIEPSAARTLAAELAERGVGFVDAPVSGGVVGAEAGTLAIMAGGEAEDVEAVRPLVAPLSSRFTHLGGPGAGQVAKVCNQMIVACNAMVLAEVVGLAEAAGVDAARLPEALRGGFADSIPFQLLVPRMAARRFEPVQWRVRTLLKDLDTAVKLSREHAASTPMSGQAAQLFRMHACRGHADQDPSTLVALYRED